MFVSNKKGKENRKTRSIERIVKKTRLCRLYAAISLMRENKLKAKVVSMDDLGNSYKDGVGTEIIPD